MAIPGILFHDAPPPLPPPKLVDTESEWRWAARDSLGTPKRLVPVRAGSSLYGGYRQPAVEEGDTSDQDTEEASAMDTSEYTSRRDSGISNVYSPTQAERQLKGPFSNLFKRSPSPSHSQQRLHGETMRAQENITQSSQAYDRGMLLKIGKPASPPRHGRLNHLDKSAITSPNISFHTNQSRPPPLSPRDQHPIGSESRSQWGISPTSTGVSPASHSEWSEHHLNSTRPPADSSSVSVGLGQEILGQRIRPAARLASNGLNSASYEPIDHIHQAHPASHDRSISGESDIEISRKGKGGFRYLVIGNTEIQETSPKQGMKRRAPSPSPESPRGDGPGSSGEPQSKTLAPKHTWSSSPRFSSVQHGSISSTASSAQAKSYNSSLGSSLAGSSLTTASLGDEKSSSNSLQRVSSLTNAPSTNSSLPVMGSLQTQFSTVPQDATPDDSKASIRRSVGGFSSQSLPNRIGNYYICSCCPKKPKKFDTEEELQSHQMEKQYTCQYCNNRFKNKNEAERHQNSLHLRRQSWSCSAITSFEAAFYSPTSARIQNPEGLSASAICGFCGEEFPNHPAPDWEKRVEHLLSVHKFGECNQAKKFFRADHFRQHLKHSHAGQSGKWTNVLENVCLRDEGLDPAVASTVSVSPVDNSGSVVGSTSTQVAAEQGSVSPNFSERSLPSPAEESTTDNRERRKSSQVEAETDSTKDPSVRSPESQRRHSESVTGLQQHTEPPGEKARRASGASSEILITKPDDSDADVDTVRSERVGVVITSKPRSTSKSSIVSQEREITDALICGG